MQRFIGTSDHRRRQGSFVATHGFEARNRRFEHPTLGACSGLDKLRLFELVAFDVAHHLNELVHAHRLVKLQLGKRRLLKHLAVGIKRLQLHDETAFLLGPDPVAISDTVFGRQQKHIGLKPCHAVQPFALDPVEVGDAVISRLQQFGKQPQGLTLFAPDYLLLWHEGDDAIVVPKDRARGACQRFDPFNLPIALAHMPDLCAGHVAPGGHDVNANIGLAARCLMHTL